MESTVGKVPQRGRSWDDLVELAAGVAQTDGGSNAAGIILSYDNLVSLTYALSGRLTSDGGTTVDIRNDGFVRALEILSRLVERKAVVIDQNRGRSLRRFMAGEATLTFAACAMTCPPISIACCLT